MKKIFLIFTVIMAIFLTTACQTVTSKIDKKTAEEEKELSKWLNQPEVELKIEFGKPDKIEFLENGNRNYIYISKKLKIKCERKFEINAKNEVIGFSSKNCF